MPKTLTSLRCASRSQLVPGPGSGSVSGHVWISDDLLSEAFNTFARSHRRHGSNIPGPLEARRRAARRRATSLAHSAVGVPSFDPVGLFGAQPQEEWWKKPETSIQRSHSPAWPWPFGAPQLPYKPPPAPVPVPSLPLARQTSKDDHVEEIKTSPEAFLMGFKHVRTHAALLKLMEGCDVNLVQNPHIARDCLEQMLAQAWHIEEITNFLLDPRTNPTGSSNHAHLCHESRKYTATFRSLISKDILVKAARLGLITVEDFRNILLLVTRMRATMLPWNVSPATLCNELLDALEDSTVLSLHDLGTDFVQKWLGAIQQPALQPSTPHLLWRLHESLNLPELERLKTVWTTGLSMTGKDNVSNLRYLVNFTLSRPQELVNKAIFESTLTYQESAESTPQPEMSAMAERADADFRRGLVARVCDLHESLTKPSDLRKIDHAKFMRIKPSSNDMFIPLERNLTTLDLWYAFLAGLGSNKAKPFIMSRTSLRNWLDDETHLVDPKQKLIVGLWVAMALSTRDDPVLSDFMQLDVGQELFQSFAAESHQRGEDILAGVLDLLHSSRLPGKNKLLQRIHVFSDNYLNVKLPYSGLRIRLADLRDAKILNLRNNVIYDAVRHHYPTLLTRIAESMNSDLAHFEATGRKLIRETKGSTNLVCRLLSHNTELKLALTNTSKWIAMDKTKWRRDGYEAHSVIGLGDYTHTQLLDMINNFAMECATANQCSARNAFRRTHWLYTYLRVHGAPILPQMLRALWFAAVKRPDNANYGDISYVQKLVANFDSPTAAQELIDGGKVKMTNWSLERVQCWIQEGTAHAGPKTTDNDTTDGVKKGRDVIRRRIVRPRKVGLLFPRAVRTSKAKLCAASKPRYPHPTRTTSITVSPRLVRPSLRVRRWSMQASPTKGKTTNDKLEDLSPG